MNLTYKLIDNGYIILNNGVKWIEQKGYIPYPSETLEQSAQLHIDEMLKNEEQAQKNISDVESLKDRVETQEQAIKELSVYIGTLGV